jgi:hypothetical protein
MHDSTVGTVVPRGAAEARAPCGLTEAQAAVRLRARPPEGPSASSRSYRSIVVANVLTVFNLVLLVAGIATLTLGDWRDAMFLGILVANTAIGIAQEVRAKRALDRLAALVTPSATVLRDERARTVAIAEVVPGDLALLAAGDQVTADGALVEADALTLDEAILTGESDPVARRAGDTVRSGSFVVDGAGSYVVHAVGSASYEQAIAGEARAFRHPRSPLELVRGGVVAARRDETRCSATRRRRRRGRTRPSRSPRGAGGAPWSRAASRPSSVCPSASRSTAWSRACAPRPARGGGCSRSGARRRRPPGSTGATTPPPASASWGSRSSRSAFAPTPRRRSPSCVRRAWR